MDPVSIVGLIASIVSITDAVGKSIRKLSDLRSKYHNVPFQVTTLIGQLYIIQTAVNELANWKTRNFTHDPRYRQLAVQIDTSLDCFCPLVLSLQQYLDNIEIALASSSNVPHIKGRIAYLWNQQDIGNYLDLIDRQVNALNLFLLAIQCSTWTEQQNKLEEEDSQAVLRRAKDCSSSIMGFVDGSSIVTENTTAISIQFDFDSILMGSLVYQAAHRSHLRQAIKIPHRRGNSQPTTIDPPSAPLLEHNPVLIDSEILVDIAALAFEDFTWYRVVEDFEPTMNDELELKVGQLVRLLYEFDDGWALCYRKRTLETGVIPRTCVSAEPPEPPRKDVTLPTSHIGELSSTNSPTNHFEDGGFF